MFMNLSEEQRKQLDSDANQMYDLFEQAQQRNEENMPPSLPRVPEISVTPSAPYVYVEDLLTVFPEISKEGETDQDFARKIMHAAGLARKEDAYEDLRDRVRPVRPVVKLSDEDIKTINRFKERGIVIDPDLGIDPDCGA